MTVLTGPGSVLRTPSNCQLSSAGTVTSSFSEPTSYPDLQVTNYSRLSAYRLAGCGMTPLATRGITTEELSADAAQSL